MISEVTNEDCQIMMGRYPDKFFDLAIVDPPYGIGEDGRNNHTRGSKATANDYRGNIRYDNEPPPPEYFDMLKRKSKNQIIWGAHHFIDNLPFNVSSPCWLIWDKLLYCDFADCELAWTSFNSAAKKFVFRWSGMLQGNMKNKETRIHPNHKPIALYKWLLKNYAKPGDKILDTHLGSGSSRIAAYKLGFDFWAAELDYDYWLAQEERFKKSIHEPLFQTQPEVKQKEIFE